MPKCFECGNPAEHNHHVVPKSKGGTKTVPLCFLCHNLAHGKEGRGSNHRELTINGIKKAREKGIKLGAAVYGTKWTLDPNEQAYKIIEIPVEKEILMFILHQREQGASYSSIAKSLVQKGIPTKNGGRWQAATVWKIIRRTDVFKK